MLYSQEDLISKSTSLYFILQAFLGTICIPTHSNCSQSEHFCPSEFGSRIADYVRHSSLPYELCISHDSLHHLMSFDFFSFLPLNS